MTFMRIFPQILEKHVFHKDPQPDQNQNHTAQNPGFFFDHRTETFPHCRADQAQSESDAANQQTGGKNIDMNDREADSHCQSVDTGGNCLHQDRRQRQRFIPAVFTFRFPAFLPRFFNHIQPDHAQQDQRDPMVD